MCAALVVIQSHCSSSHQVTFVITAVFVCLAGSHRAWWIELLVDDLAMAEDQAIPANIIVDGSLIYFSVAQLHQGTVRARVLR